MKTIKGDLIKRALEGHYDIIVHGCNCFCAMGAGIAKQIKTVFPTAYIVDTKTIKGDKDKLGNYTFALCPIDNNKKIRVINAYTQYKYSRGKQADYKAIGKVFRTLKNDFGSKGLKFGIPKIGDGLAGGDWNLISKIIETELYDEDIELVIYDGN